MLLNLKQLVKKNKYWYNILFTKGNLLCLFFLLSASVSLRAQYFFAYRDTLGILYVYDDGYIRRMEERPVKSFRYGTNGVAFTNQMDEFKVYVGTGSQVIAEGLPKNFQFSRSMLAYEFSGNLYTYWNGRSQRLSAFVANYTVHDSLICFYDRTDAFKIFYDGTVYNINRVPVLNYKAKRNIAAYNTNASIFKLFFRGKVRTLENYEITAYQVGRNTVGYLDQTGRLKVYNSGQVYMLEELTPNFWFVGDDIVMYHTKNNDFKVFYKDSAYRLETYLPPTYDIVDGLVYYVDENNRLKVFDRGKVHIIEGFLPNNIKVFNNRLAYLNIYKNLMLYENDEVKNISNEVVNDFWLNGDLIVYHSQISDLVFVGRGNPYRIRYNWQKF